MAIVAAHVRIDRHRCLGAGTCVLLAPTAFGWYRNELHKATLLDPSSVDEDLMREVAYACPTQAIILDEEEAAANEVLGRLGGASAPVAERWSDGAGPSAVITGDGGSEPAAARRTRTFMFTDIVDSTKLAEALGEAKWQKLLAWHDRTLRELLQAEGGDVIKQTGDGFFAAFDSPAAGVEAAVSVQRALDGYEGIAPDVRIGLHAGGAFAKDEGDYGGQGVHAAARIGALGGAGEILVSSDTLADTAIRYPVKNTRRAELKGIEEPVEITEIAWR